MDKRENPTHYQTPVGPLGIVALDSIEPLGKKVDQYLVEWRADNKKNHSHEIAYQGYSKDTFLVKAKTPRFGSGEAKGMLQESVRGKDLYILCDVTNYSITYKLAGEVNYKSPDDHFQDIKRIVAAASGKARRINVIMPFLYEGRQHKRTIRESLDCAIALQELVKMGVDNIVTFDAHDPRVQNAIPLHGFETVRPSYQFIQGLLDSTPDLQIDSDHLMMISPDEGATARAIYMASLLGIDMGMFYKRRDYTRLVGGRNPIVAHEFLGRDLEGKDAIVIDDMISSGESILDVAKELKKRGAKRIFMMATFGLFTNGYEVFDKAYEEGIFTKIISTNLTYQEEELLNKPYYVNCDMSKYVALIIDNLNHDGSLGEILDPVDKIQAYVKEYKDNQQL